MAEVTAFRNNALPYPVYGVAFTVTFPLLDADGDPVSPSSPDSEVSKNGDTFADCTNEATEIATSSGICYLLLTAAEMTADIVTVRIQSTGAKTTVLTLYPRKLAVLSTGTCQGANDTGDIQLASGDSAIDDIYNGCLCVAVIDTVTEARIINDYVGSTKVGEVSPAWNTAIPDNNDTYTIYAPEGWQPIANVNVSLWNNLATVALPLVPTTAGRTLDVASTGEAGLDFANVNGTITNAMVADDVDVNVKTITAGAITASSIAADAITDAKVASDVTIASVTGAVGSVTGAVGSVTGAVGSVTGNVGGNVVGSVASVTGNVGGNVTGSVGSVVGAVGSVTGAVGSVTGNVGGNVTGSVGSVAAGGITASSIAADAIGASELAADAVTEIVTGLLAGLVDGVALSTVLTRIYAATAGDATIAGSGPYVLEYDGPGGTVIITATANAGARSNVYA